MNILHEKRRMLPMGCPQFGGSSKSATTTSTEVSDQRVVGGDDSINVSSRGSVSVVTTDAGAVAGGIALGSKAIDAAVKSAEATSASSSQLFEGALGAVSDANERLALAYQSGNAGEQTMLKYAGFVVVGLAALAFVGANLRR